MHIILLWHDTGFTHRQQCPTCQAVAVVGTAPWLMALLSHRGSSLMKCSASHLPGSGDGGHSAVVDGVHVLRGQHGQHGARDVVVAQALGQGPRKDDLGQPLQPLQACKLDREGTGTEMARAQMMLVSCFSPCRHPSFIVRGPGTDAFYSF